MSYFGVIGTLILFLAMSPLGFKARLGSTLFAFLQRRAQCVCPLRITSGATPANLLMTSIAVSHLPACMFQQR